MMELSLRRVAVLAIAVTALLAVLIPLAFTLARQSGERAGGDLPDAPAPKPGSLVLEEVVGDQGQLVGVGFLLDGTSAGGQGLFLFDRGGWQLEAKAPMGASIHDLAITDLGVIAVGSDDRGPAVWELRSGQLVPVLQRPRPPAVPVESWPASQLGGLTVTGRSVIAVGHEADAAGDWRPLVARGDDAGWTWVEVDGGGRMEDVAESGGGLIAVGSTGTATPQAAAWRSDTGLTWELVAVPALRSDDRLRWTSMSELASRGAGVVAIGQRGPLPVIWWSPDGGASWVPSTDGLPDAKGAPRLLDVGVDDAGQYVITGVAVGLEDQMTSLVWISDDGTAWSRDPTAPTIPERYQLGHTADGLVLLGTEDRDGLLIPSLVPRITPG